jgi:hypothetical protein
MLADCELISFGPFLIRPSDLKRASEQDILAGIINADLIRASPGIS